MKPTPHTQPPADTSQFRLSDLRDMANDMHSMRESNTMPAKLAAYDGERIDWICDQHAQLAAENAKMREALESRNKLIEQLNDESLSLREALEETTEALRRAMQHVPGNAVNMEIALNAPIADARTLGYCERVFSAARAALSASTK